MEDESAQRRKKSRCESFRDWIGSPSFYIYVNYFLGAWGDRMWQFAVGLYLVKLSGGMLRLAAIFGFCRGGCVMLFGGLIGHWVDRNPRLRVMITTLSLQNISVMLSACAVCFTLFYADWIDNTLNGGMRYLCEAVIVTVAIFAQMSSVGYKIAIEKDWIVVIAAGNKALLANLNAVTRAIDLSCKLLAPTSVGFIMTYGSDEIAAIVIAVWNILSLLVEFALLRKVYSLVPALAVKGKDKHEEVPAEEEDDQDRRVSLNPKGGDDDELNEVYDRQESSQPLKGKRVQEKKHEKKTCVQIMFHPFITLVKGWRTYARQKVVFAGLSLSFLYMTVLGFDSITLGYIYANGIKEYLVAIAMGLAGFTGILGTISFTFSRKRVGLERTGLFAFSAEILCLSLCVASVFAPGSPFKPFYNHQEALLHCRNGRVNTSKPAVSNVSSVNVEKREIGSLHPHGQSSLDTFPIDEYGMAWNAEVTFVGVPAASHGDLPSVSRSEGSASTFGHSFNVGVDYNVLHNHIHVIRRRQATNATDPNLDPAVIDRTEGPETTGRPEGQDDDPDSCIINRELISYVSIILFLVGVVTSRVGLWMADLVVTQLLQENVVESERGTVSGVQNSLNMVMDMLKFTLVIAVPHIPHFGYLIIASFSFICMAGCLFAYHSWRVRGHLFHFEKLCQCGRAHAANGHTVVTKAEVVELAVEAGENQEKV